MMSSKKIQITELKVKEIAELANISLTKEEIIRYQPQLQDILKYVDKLSEIDTDDSEYLPDTNLKNVLREDIFKPSLKQKEVLSGRKKNSSKGFFIIKSVLKK